MSILGFKIWRVSDESMTPSIPKNSYVIVNHWFRFNWFSIENIVLIQHHFYGLILKKIVVIDKNGFIWGRSENNASLPIEQLGPMNKNQIVGRVLYICRSKS